MFVSEFQPDPSADPDLAAALDTVLHQYRAWCIRRFRLHAQLASDVALPNISEEQAARLLQHTHLFAAALRAVADQLEHEVADTTDRFYTWLYD
jgi:hypothetical protein